jgi:hypothetical protein
MDEEREERSRLTIRRTPSGREVEVEWEEGDPEPRDDPPEEPSHRAARIADRERGEERGDVEDEDREEG